MSIKSTFHLVFLPPQTTVHTDSPVLNNQVQSKCMYLAFTTSVLCTILVCNQQKNMSLSMPASSLLQPLTTITHSVSCPLNNFALISSAEYKSHSTVRIVYSGFVCILKTLQFLESDFRALKVAEIGVWSLKVLDLLLNKIRKCVKTLVFLFPVLPPLVDGTQ